MNNLKFLAEIYALTLANGDKLDKKVKEEIINQVKTAVLTVSMGLKGDKLIVASEGSTRIEHANGGESTVAVNTTVKAGVQKEIPFRDKASDKGKGKEADLATSKPDVSTEGINVSADKTEQSSTDSKVEDKGEDTTASTTQENTASENSTEQEESTVVAEEPVVTAETELGKTTEETTEEVVDKYAKNRMTTEEALAFTKEYMIELFMGPKKDGKGKRNNDRPTRNEINEMIMTTFPTTEEESKETKEGNIKRNKIQDQLWREITTEMKEKLAKKEDKVTAEASKSVDTLIDTVKAELKTEKPIEEPAKIPVNTDLDKTKIVTAEEIQAGEATTETTTVEVVAEEEVDDLTKIANEAAAEQEEQSKIVNLPEKDLSKCPVGEFFETMKEILIGTSDEDLDNNEELLKKWVNHLNSGSSLPDRSNLIGTKAIGVIKKIFEVIKKENLKRKAA